MRVELRDVAPQATDAFAEDLDTQDWEAAAPPAAPKPGEDLTTEIEAAAPLWASAHWWLEQMLNVFGAPVLLATQGLRPDIADTLRLWVSGVEALVCRLVTAAALLIRLPALRAPRARCLPAKRRAFNPRDIATWFPSLRYWRMPPAPRAPVANDAALSASLAQREAEDFGRHGVEWVSPPCIIRRAPISRWDPTNAFAGRATSAALLAFDRPLRSADRKRVLHPAPVTSARPSVPVVVWPRAAIRFDGHAPVFAPPPQLSLADYLAIPLSPRPTLALRIEALRRTLARPGAAARRLAWRMARMGEVFLRPLGDWVPPLWRKKGRKPPGWPDVERAQFVRYVAYGLRVPSANSS